MIRLMIVDDEMLMIDGMAAMLADLSDIQVVAKETDARKVLATAQAAQPMIVIMDVLMNTGDGRDCTKQLCQALPGIRVIGCSTSTAPSTIQAMLDAGALGYITKSEPEGELEAMIRHFAGSAQVRLSRHTTQALDDPRLSISSLTPREREVLGRLCRGIIPKQITDELGMSLKTVYSHVENIRSKAGVNNLIQLYPLAVREGLIELPG